MLDPAPIVHLLRAKASSHLLVAAVHHLQVFELLAGKPRNIQDLQSIIGLKDRPAMVLFPALCAMKLLKIDEQKELSLTDLGKFLTSTKPINLVSYTGLEKEDPGVLQMRDHLLNDGLKEAASGLAYVMETGDTSPMDEPATATYFTEALAGRAAYLSPLVAEGMGKKEGYLLDLAGGSGYFSFEWLKVHKHSTATILDRPAVLNVAKANLKKWCLDRPEHADVEQRVIFLPANMIDDDFPAADIVLAASMFHDWPVETCELLSEKIAKSLQTDGELWVHDAFLDDHLNGPIGVTDYSALLFLATKGRCYSRAEMRAWFNQAGLTNQLVEINTLLDYSLICAIKR